MRWLLLFLVSAVISPPRGPVGIEFPTPNRALLENRPEEFYMYVNRNFEGRETQPWEGGQFGFVRGPIRTGSEVVFATVHEGIDIKPVHRDPAGNPLDDVTAAAAGLIVHTSTEAGASNYGRYVVIEHTLGQSPFYTLYAHLSTIVVRPGDRVAQGTVIGRMGYTGEGIDRPRAHLHFEVALLLSRNFQGWYEAFRGGSPNKHGLYNGMNLVGMDPSAVLLAAYKEPSFDLRRHVRGLDPAFRITVPASSHFTLLREHPWLVPDGENANPPAWTVTFTRTGVPVRITAATAPVSSPRLDWVAETGMAYHHFTRGLVGGSKGSPHLTESGQRFARLLTWPD